MASEAHVIDRLKHLIDATNRVLDRAEHAGINDAVNWADLSCISARRIEDESGDESWQVIVSEAAPDAHDLQEYVAGELGARWGHVEVVTEW